MSVAAEAFTTDADFHRHAAAGCNRIPLMREVLADMDTPLSAYLKLARGRNSYLLESMQGGEKWGRYSIIGLPARELLRVRGAAVERVRDGAVVSSEQSDDPLAAVRAFHAGFRAPAIARLPRFCGGLVGYFGYDTVRCIEPRLRGGGRPDPLDADDMVLLVSEELAVFDNYSGRLLFLIYVDPAEDNAYARGQQRLDELQEMLGQTAPRPPAAGGEGEGGGDCVSHFGRGDFEAAVESARV